jgi:hypothetical protein
MNWLTVTAFPLMGGLHVQLKSGHTTDTRRDWTILVQETIDFQGDLEDDWSAVWAIGELMCRAALEHGAAEAWRTVSG